MPTDMNTNNSLNEYYLLRNNNHESSNYKIFNILLNT